MKNNSLIKKNKPLVIVLGITFLGSCILIFRCLSISSDIRDLMARIEEDDRSVQLIYTRKSPNPVKESERIILGNAVNLQARMRSLFRCVGRPYRFALQDFLVKMESAAFLKNAPLAPVEEKNQRGNTSPAAQSAPSAAAVANAEPVVLKFSEDEILNLFAEVYEKFNAERKNTEETRDNDTLMVEREELFNVFRKELLEASCADKTFESEEAKEAYLAAAGLTFDKALYQFRLKVQIITLEQLNQQDTRMIFMDALGLPRTMTSFQCKVFVDEFLTHIRRNPSFIPGLEKIVKTKDSKAELSTLIEMKIPEYTFNHKNQLPPPGNVVHILRHYRIIEDIFRRMRDSKIQFLLKMESPFSEKPTGDLAGDPVKDLQGSYKKYAYEVTVVSSLSEIRDFVNSLHQAYTENYVYDIQSMSFFKNPQMDAVDSANKAVEEMRKVARAEEEARDAQKEAAEAEQKKAGKLRTELEERIAQKEQQQNADKAVRIRTPEDIYSDDSYGVVMIGEDERVTAVIRFNYLVYTGDFLGKQSD